MARGPESFTRLGTLGIEEEFYIVDEAGRPVAGTDELVYETEPPAILEGRLDHELFKFVIETQTPLIEDLGAAGATMREVRAALCSHAREHGYEIAAAGLHPTADWRELEHAEKPRYRSQLDRIQYPQHRNITAGLHIHVGIDDADKAVWVANELRWSLALVLAVSVNSPFWCGFDTGLASARATIFEALPNTGMPTAFESYADFEAFETAMIDHDAIDDRGELWFDVRPHSGHGTVEIRVPDAQADADVAMTLVRYVYAAVQELCDRYADGAPGNDWRRELLDENKWRALRYGHDAALFDRDFESTVPVPELAAREADRLDVPGLRTLVDRDSGASRQRAIYQAGGPDALCRSLLLEED